MNGDEMYAWQELDEGGWGMIAAGFADADSVIPLVARNLNVAQQWRPLAEFHRETSGNPVRLASFIWASTVEEL